MFSRPPPSFQDFQLSKLYRSVLNKKKIYSYELSVYSKNKEYQSVVVKNVQEKKDIYIFGSIMEPLNCFPTLLILWRCNTVYVYKDCGHLQELA